MFRSFHYQSECVRGCYYNEKYASNQVFYGNTLWSLFVHAQMTFGSKILLSRVF